MDARHKPMLIEVERDRDVCILRVSGHLLTGTDPGFLRSKTEEIKRQDCVKLLADLRQLESIGSTGIGFLLGIYASICKNQHGRFVMVGLQPRVLKVFELTHLSNVMSIRPDVPSGLEALRDEVVAKGA
jgi:anti-anti-sigma factor